MFCSNCGSQLPDNSRFCRNCGERTDAPSEMYAGNGPVREERPAPGFSDRVNHPEILAAIKKSRRAAKIFGLFIIPLPFIGFMIYSAVSDKMETKDAALYGGIVSAVFLLFAAVSFIRERAANTYDAVVIDKKKRIRRENSDNDNRVITYEYITVVRKEGGGKKKYTEHDGSRLWAYNYLQVGDKFRFHPQFHFPYELYDKSKIDCIYCVGCQTKNSVLFDRCKQCGLPLLK